MFKKKYAVLVLLSLLICLVAISSVSAEDNLTDEGLNVEEAAVDEIAFEDDVNEDSINDNVLSNGDDVIVGESDDELLTIDDDEKLSVDETQDVVSSSSPYSYEYSINVDDTTLIDSKGGDITVKITPSTNSVHYAYDFRLKVIDNNNEVKLNPNLYSDNQIESLKYNIAPNQLTPGIYTIELQNYEDNVIMDNATLTVIDEESAPHITVEINYDETINVYTYDANTLNPVSVPVSIYSSKADKTWYVNTNFEGKYSLDPILPTGTYSFTASVARQDVISNSAEITGVSITAKPVKFTISQSGTYYNDKTLTVKVSDLNTNAVIGSVKFSLAFSNGKTVSLTTNSNGIATYKVPYSPGTYTVQASVSGSYEGQSSKVTVKIVKHKGTITLKTSGKYYKSKKITVKVVDSFTKKVVAKQAVKIKFSNGKTVTVKTNSKGVATYTIKYNPGKYSATASASNNNIAFAPKKVSNIKISKIPVKINSKKVKTAYGSGKYFYIKVINKATKKGVKGVKLKIKIKGAKTIARTSGSGGQIKISASKFSIGTHKVIMKVMSKKFHTGKTKTNKIIVKKGYLDINAPESINCYKQSDEYKVRVTNKISGDSVKGIKVVMKVYTGKKVKKYTVKTDSDGYASFNTKSLSKATHKVVVLVKANKYYKSAKSEGSVQITKKIPTTIGYEPGLIFHATQNWITPYSWTTHTYDVQIFVTLKDKNGKELYKPVTLYHSDGNTASGTSGGYITVDGGRPGTVTLKFAGDKKYMASEYVVELGNEP